jgi:hypothetical protein
MTGPQHRAISDTDTSELANAWAQNLFIAINRFAVGRPMEQGVIDAIREIVTHERNVARGKGIDIPELVVVPLPVQRSVEIFRRDLDQQGIANVIVRLAAKYPGITEQEIAHAVRGAWPEYQRSLM